MSVKQILGTVASVAGTILLAIPGLQPAGVALIAVGAGLNYSAARDEAKKAAARAAINRSQPPGVTGNLASGDAAHQIVFGTRRVGGVYVALKTSGNNNENLNIGLAHSITHAGGIDGLQGFYVNETPVGITVSSAGAGVDQASVSAGDFANVVNIKTYKGLATQSADSGFVGLGVDTSTAYRRGIAWSAIRLTRNLQNEAGFQKAFGGGLPNVTAIIRGLLCYDVRKDSTMGGSGAQRTNDPTTWAFSNNPAVVGATYLIMRKLDGGCGEPVANIDWASVAAAANVCDQTVSGLTGPQFQCDIVLSTADDCIDNVAKIAQTMAGDIIPVAGLWTFRAAGTDVSLYTITDDWLAGGAQVTIGAGLDSLYNAVRASYAEPSKNWQYVEAPNYVDASYESADGGERLYRDITISGCVDSTRAQWLAAIEARSSRLQNRVTLLTSMVGLQVDVNKCVTLSLSEWPALTGLWRVGTRDIVDREGRLLVQLGLEQADNAVFNTVTFGSNPSGNVFAPTYEVPQTPASLSATPVADGIVLQWSPYAGATGRPLTVGTYFVVEHQLGDGSWEVLGATTATSVKVPYLTGGSQTHRVKATNQFGVDSAYTSAVTVTPKQVQDGATKGAILGTNTYAADGSTVISNQDGIPDGAVYQRNVNRATDNLLVNGDFGASGTVLPPPGWATPGATVNGIPSQIVAPASYAYSNGQSFGGPRVLTIVAGASGGTYGITYGRSFTVRPGEVYTVGGNLYANSGGAAQVYLRFFDVNGGYLSDITATTATTGAGPNAYSASGTVPASAVSALVFILIANGSSGATAAQFDSIYLFKVKSLDTEVRDGSTYGRTVQAALTSGQPDLSKGGVVNRTLDYINDTGSYARTSAARVSSGKPWIDFSESIHSNKNVDNIADGSVYLRGVNRSADNLLENGDFGASGTVLPPPMWTVSPTTVNGFGAPVATPASYGYANGQSFGGPRLLTIVAGASASFYGLTYGRAFRVRPGEVYTVSANVYVNNSVGSAQIYFRYYDASGNFLSDLMTSSNATVPTAVSNTGTVPANAVTGLLFILINNSSGTPAAQFDSVALYKIKSLDSEVRDGATYGRVVQAALSSNQPDLSKGGILNRLLDYIADTASYARTIAGRVSFGKPWIDLSEGINTNRTLDNISDTAAYARLAASQVTGGQHRLTVAGSGLRMGDQRNSPALATGGLRSRWSGQTISYSYDNASPANVTISVSASTLLIGTSSVSYNAMSTTVSFTRGATYTYYLFVDDAAYAGGAQTLQVTGDPNVPYQLDSRIYVGSVTVTVPASGTGSGSGSGGGGSCVTARMLDGIGRRFESLDEGDRLHACEPDRTLAVQSRQFEAVIRKIRLVPEPCVRITTRNGAVLECSLSAPLCVAGEARPVQAEALTLDDALLTRVGGICDWSPIAAIEDIGPQLVCPVDAGDVWFWAGASATAQVLHHNKIVP